MDIRSYVAASLFALSLHAPYLAAESKVSCKEAEAVTAKCAEYDEHTKVCAELVKEEGKKKIDAAKQEQADCKAKHGATYMLKCKNEVKKATTLANTPKALLNSNVEKELVAVADSPCAKAGAIGSQQPLCKGPKKVLEVYKANCIKD